MASCEKPILVRAGKTDDETGDEEKNDNEKNKYYIWTFCCHYCEAIFKYRRPELKPNNKRFSDLDDAYIPEQVECPSCNRSQGIDIRHGGLTYEILYIVHYE
jgi:hypothetical protein